MPASHTRSIHLHPQFADEGIELVEGVELDAEGAGAFFAAGADAVSCFRKIT